MNAILYKYREIYTTYKDSVRGNLRSFETKMLHQLTLLPFIKRKYAKFDKTGIKTSQAFITKWTTSAGVFKQKKNL